MSPTEFESRYPDLTTPPALSLLLTELRMPLVLGNMALSWRSLPRVRSGQARPVLLLPGFGMPAQSMELIRRYLLQLGYDAHCWSLGRNNGDVKGTLPGIEQDVDRLAQASGLPVNMVGWSLGGTMARELAREDPTCIEHIVTLGSPVVGGPKFTAFKPLFERRGFDLDRAANTVLSRYRKPLQTPVTALVCKKDSIVQWQACEDRFSDTVTHIDIRTPHMSMPFSSEVLSLLHDHL